jgi:hypothetical protein
MTPRVWTLAFEQRGASGRGWASFGVYPTRAAAEAAAARFPGLRFRIRGVQ